MVERRAVLVLTILTGSFNPRSTSAQTTGRPILLSPHASVVRVTAAAPATAVGRVGRPLILSGGAPTYWLEGGLIGAALGGAAGYFGAKAVANGICTGSDAGMCNDYNLQIGVGGAVLGFLIGTAIGNHHPKPTATTSPSVN